MQIHSMKVSSSFKMCQQPTAHFYFDLDLLSMEVGLPSDGDHGEMSYSFLMSSMKRLGTIW